MEITLDLLQGAIHDYACIKTQDFSLDVEIPRGTPVSIALRERAQEYRTTSIHYARLAEKCDEAASLIPVGIITAGKSFANQTMNVDIKVGAVHAYAFVADGNFKLDVQLPHGMGAPKGLEQRACEFRALAQENAELAEKCELSADIAWILRNKDQVATVT